LYKILQEYIIEVHFINFQDV